MGLLSRHKGEKAHKFSFVLHIHTLSWPSAATAAVQSLCVVYERGSHSGSTKRAAPSSPRSGQAAYAFEESLHLPVTLYQVRGSRNSAWLACRLATAACRH